ncbi:MAG: hypothetical protein ACE5LA_07845 [Dehalococcoidales bacterium]
MEVAIGLVSVALAILGIILVYIYRTNGRYMRALLDGQREIQNGLKELQAGQREIAAGIKDVAMIARDIHERMERR